MISRQVVLRYTLMQLPEMVIVVLLVTLLGQWTIIPWWAVLIVIALWVIVNIIMFPFVWRAYDKNTTSPMFGSQGITADSLSPNGYVRIHGEMWRAKVIEGCSFIQKGETVKVTGIRGLTLIVQPETNEKP